MPGSGSIRAPSSGRAKNWPPSSGRNSKIKLRLWIWAPCSGLAQNCPSGSLSSSGLWLRLRLRPQAPAPAPAPCSGLRLWLWLWAPGSGLTKNCRPGSVSGSKLRPCLQAPGSGSGSGSGLQAPADQIFFGRVLDGPPGTQVPDPSAGPTKNSLVECRMAPLALKRWIRVPGPPKIPWSSAGWPPWHSSAGSKCRADEKFLGRVPDGPPDTQVPDPSAGPTKNSLVECRMALRVPGRPNIFWSSAGRPPWHSSAGSECRADQ